MDPSNFWKRPVTLLIIKCDTRKVTPLCAGSILYVSATAGPESPIANDNANIPFVRFMLPPLSETIAVTVNAIKKSHAGIDEYLADRRGLEPRQGRELRVAEDPAQHLLDA